MQERSPESSSLCQAIRLRPGLELRCSDRRHAHRGDGTGQASAGLYLVLVLAGEVQVAYGGRRLRLAPQDGAGAAGALVALRENDSFERADCGEGPERKLSLWVGHDWLEQAGLNTGRRHLEMRCWRASRRLAGLADSLIRTPAEGGGLPHLQAECRAIELLGEALAGEAPAAARPGRMQAARELLDSGAADGWSLADIALELGLHANTLQRRFREAHGCSVFDYLRRRRLLEARRALQLDGITVTEAALAAGYNSPANFATAFRRQFGMAPSRLKAAMS
ncbi:helix-turn-helix transcriptional regulator [Roseateles sp. DAIF2]|uniref:helix-turn-helix transcriptional regulator n=1 Tax=Roseateles sp. DAIF2 TaxID=2714952 RepID=UPI0018A24B0F|nr:AraC family transcriptional regulator [Roseateles sp. DAIF2]QPF72897.1 helix-turn-helix transcriptional regulator [Roseateles sp. DAIF2]